MSTETNVTPVEEVEVQSVEEIEKQIRTENEDILILADALERLKHNPDFQLLEKHYFADYAEAQARLCGSYNQHQLQEMLHNLTARGVFHRVMENIRDDAQVVYDTIEELKKQANAE